MKAKIFSGLGSFPEKLALSVSKAAGSNGAILIALFVVIVWLLCGPFFDFSEKWLQVFNTGTNILTFVMVFMIQKSQNKNSLALQLKLNELISAHDVASNDLVNAEDLTHEELQVLQNYYSRMVKRNTKSSGPNEGSGRENL